jgi:hypothetical protein
LQHAKDFDPLVDRFVVALGVLAHLIDQLMGFVALGRQLLNLVVDVSVRS